MITTESILCRTWIHFHIHFFGPHIHLFFFTQSSVLVCYVDSSASHFIFIFIFLYNFTLIGNFFLLESNPRAMKFLTHIKRSHYVWYFLFNYVFTLCSRTLRCDRNHFAPLLTLHCRASLLRSTVSFSHSPLPTNLLPYFCSSPAHLLKLTT